MPRKFESDVYVPTPMLVFGPQTYDYLKEQTEKALKRNGWDGAGIPALVFTGKGGVFVAVEAVQGMEQS